MKQRYAWLGLFLCLALPPIWPGQLQAQDRQPYTLAQLIRMVEPGVFPDGRIITLARESCLGFTLDAEARRQLRQAGASEGLIANLRQVCVSLPRVVQSVVVTPAELELSVGGSSVLRAQALAPDSSQIANVAFDWSSEDTIVADVSMGGTVVGKMPGATRIRVGTENGPWATALVRVVRGTPAEGEAVGLDPLDVERVGGKSAGTAAALGLFVPGGGEFYSGNTAKGVVVLLGAAGALAAGYLITSQEELSMTLSPTAPQSCDPLAAFCRVSVSKESEIKETRQIVIGAAVAGAFWLYGLVDGIRSAKRAPGALLEGEGEGDPGLSLELVPADGLRLTASGDTQITLIRIRS